MTFFCTVSNAQNENEFDCYCSIRFIYNGSSSHVLLKMPDNKSEMKILGEDDKTARFNNETEGLTYMSQRGWIYLNSYLDYQNDRWLLMVKKVKSIEEAYKDIKTNKKKD